MDDAHMGLNCAKVMCCKSDWCYFGCLEHEHYAKYLGEMVVAVKFALQIVSAYVYVLNQTIIVLFVSPVSPIKLGLFLQI